VRRPNSSEIALCQFSKHLWLGDIDFGPWQFDVVDLTLPPGFDGFMGYNFFAKHVVCMDFPGRRLLVQK